MAALCIYFLHFTTDFESPGMLKSFFFSSLYKFPFSEFELLFVVLRVNFIHVRHHVALFVRHEAAVGARQPQRGVVLQPHVPPQPRLFRGREAASLALEAFLRVESGGRCGRGGDLSEGRRGRGLRVAGRGGRVEAALERVARVDEVVVVTLVKISWHLIKKFRPDGLGFGLESLDVDGLEIYDRLTLTVQVGELGVVVVVVGGVRLLLLNRPHGAFGLGGHRGRLVPLFLVSLEFVLRLAAFSASRAEPRPRQRDGDRGRRGHEVGLGRGRVIKVVGVHRASDGFKKIQFS